MKALVWFRDEWISWNGSESYYAPCDRAGTGTSADDYSQLLKMHSGSEELQGNKYKAVLVRSPNCELRAANLLVRTLSAGIMWRNSTEYGWRNSWSGDSPVPGCVSPRNIHRSEIPASCREVGYIPAELQSFDIGWYYLWFVTTCPAGLRQ